MSLKPKQILSDLFRLALDAVNGCRAVELQLQQTPIDGSIAIIAIGKAASAMMLGAQNQLKDKIQSALIITKAGYGDPMLKWPCLESGHPVPNEISLVAGTKLLEFIKNIPKDTKILALISGGASSLVEVLPESMSLEKLQKTNEWLIGSGLTIHEINQIRCSLSLIKGGKTLSYLSHHEMVQFLISDVKNDDPAVIGSGLFVTNTDKNTQINVPDWISEIMLESDTNSDVLVKSHIIASNALACQAIINEAKQLNYPVTYHGQNLFGDVYERAALIAEKLKNGKPGVHIWGGETTITLPHETGRGGRNQSLALELAIYLENINDITVLVGATDGSDGPTDDAGAIIDGFTLSRGKHIGSAKDYLMAADAGTFLAEAGDLLSTGPTGTNVMDIVIALKEPINTENLTID